MSIFRKKEQFRETIYQAIAKECLKSWNGFTDEQAVDFVKNKSFEEIEAQIGAKGSISAGITGIMEGVKRNVGTLSQYLPRADAYLDYNMYRIYPPELDFPEDEYLEYVLSGKKLKRKSLAKLMSIRYVLERVSEETRNEIAFKALIFIHDRWVAENEKKFFDPSREDRQYMFLPTLLIGWEETSKDLLFVKPILEDLGLPVDLEAFYLKKTKKAFEHLEQDEKSLPEIIGLGSEFYPALTSRISGTLKTDSSVCERISEQAFARFRKL